MNYKTVPVSEGRKNLPHFMKEVEETGDIVVFTTHGKAKVGLIDLDLLEDLIENAEFGITESELIEISKEERFGLEALEE